MQDHDMPMQPHAFHLNLPGHHLDDKDGVPYITKFAQDKARIILRLAHSIHLTESLYINENTAADDEDVDMDNVQVDEGEAHAITEEHTLVSVDAMSLPVVVPASSFQAITGSVHSF